MPNSPSNPLREHLAHLAHGKGQPAPLYIQSKGNHAGRPLRQPIANCFAVYSTHPHLYAVAFAAYSAKAYDQFIGGSVIPFLRMDDATEVLNTFILRATPEKAKQLAAIQLADDLHARMLRAADKAFRLRYQLARRL